jgi:hypothetical protein
MGEVVFFPLGLPVGTFLVLVLNAGVGVGGGDIDDDVDFIGDIDLLFVIGNGT